MHTYMYATQSKHVHIAKIACIFYPVMCLNPKKCWNLIINVGNVFQLLILYWIVVSENLTFHET